MSCRRTARICSGQINIYRHDLLANRRGGRGRPAGRCAPLITMETAKHSSTAARKTAPSLLAATSAPPAASGRRGVGRAPVEGPAEPWAAAPSPRKGARLRASPRDLAMGAQRPALTALPEVATRRRLSKAAERREGRSVLEHSPGIW